VVGRAALCCLLVCAAGCSGGDTEQSTPGGIISFSPNLTETVFALGQGDRVVARSSYCDYPPEVQALPDAGDYLSPNFEKIALLAPEMMLVAGQHEKVTQFAEMNGIRTVNAHMDDLATIESGIATVAEALGVPERGEALWKQIDGELQAVRDRVAGKPRPKVLVLTFRTDHDLNTLFTVGGSSFVSQLVDIAGGENIFADSDTPYFEASKESIVVKAPEVIIEFHAGQALTPEEEAIYRADWDALASVPAVRDGRVHLFTESYGLRPGPRVALIAEQFADWIHPETAP
jgi:iron complex transport system substrate-binding protein